MRKAWIGPIKAIQKLMQPDLVWENRAVRDSEDKRVEQAFRPAVKLPKKAGFSR